jgi:hypothetical protein
MYQSITAPNPQCQALYDDGFFPITRLIDPGLDCHFEPRHGHGGVSVPLPTVAPAGQPALSQ